MDKSYTVALVCLLTAGTAWARPLIRPDDLERSLAATPQAAPTFTPLEAVSAFNETIFFGGTTWAPDSMRWEAIQDSVWTFDTGMGSAIKEPGHTYPYVDPFKPDGFHATMEGWTGLDHTRDPGITQYFRRLSAGDSRWQAGYVAVGNPAGLGGNYSFWAGVFNEEAAALCYSRGQGYGNRWNICLGHSFPHPGGAGAVTLEYDYRNQTEPDFDYTSVRVEKKGTITEVASYTGNASGHETVTLNPGVELPNGPGTVTITFCVTSDMSWSDEDGNFPTNWGAFAVDNISLTGGITSFSDFEADDGGWVVVPSGPGVGDWSRLMALDDLPAISAGVEGNCTLADSVLVLFDPGIPGHPDLQDNVVVSPWIDLARAGAVGHRGKQIQLNAYCDLLLNNYVFMYSEAQWYPDSCSSPPRISPWTWNGAVYWHGNPICLGWASSSRTTFSTVVPDNAGQVRLAVGVLDWCSFYSCLGISNTTPWIDNVRFAVFDTNTLQDAIDAAADGDTLWIPPGTYAGIRNRNLDFKGKNLVLVASGGAEVTFIDCQSLGRGFVFQSGEDSTSVVEGFTVQNGLAPLDNYGNQESGGGILVTGGARPTIRNCRIEGSSARLGGGMAVLSGAGATVVGCTFDSNTADTGGGLWSGGEVDLDQCTFQDNQAVGGGGGAWIGGTIGNSTATGNHAGAGGGLYSFGLVHDCVISDNVADGGPGGGMVCRGPAVNCTVTGNSAQNGGGMMIGDAGNKAIGCTVSGNTATGQGGGIFVFGASIEECRVFNNSAETGGGILATIGNHFVPATLSGNLISGNEAAHGGGLALLSQDVTSIFQATNCTLSGNHGALGGGVYLDPYQQLTATRTILWGNGADSTGNEVWMDTDALGLAFSCCALDSSEIGGSGPVTYNGSQVFTNPLFCGPAAWQTAPTPSGNYGLAANSPCLDASSPCGERIGSEEETCSTTGVGDDVAGLKPGLAAYPNPFAGSLHLSFTGPEGATRAKVEIFDVRGRLVWNADLSEGSGQLDRNGRDASGGTAAPGVYFVHVRAGSLNKSARVVMLR